MEWNIGIIGHTPFTVDALFAERLALPDGTPVLRMYQYERVRRLVYRVEMLLPYDAHHLFVRVRIDNASQDDTAVYWWSNIAVDEREDVRVVVPAQRAYRWGYGGIVSKQPIPYMTLDWQKLNAVSGKQGMLDLCKMKDRVYLSIDGGGTKLQMLLYDQRLTPLGAGLAGGVNTNSTTPENSLSNVKSCLEQVFSTCRPAAIDRAYVVFVGPADVLRSELAKVLPVREYVPLSEPAAGLMAGAFWREGILALSGTGSDVFLCSGEHQPRALQQNHKAVVGGWGPLLGDQGSGAWVGQQAIRAAVSGLEGWTQPTLLLDLIRRSWKLEYDFDMVNVVHRSSAPFRQMAALTRLVAEAANLGDAVALGILREAGELMATQTLCLLRRYDIPAECKRLVCAGGTWKAHPAMFETFRERLLAQQPDLDIHWPLFEPILAGPAMVALESGATADEACTLLARHYPELKIARP